MTDDVISVASTDCPGPLKRRAFKLMDCKSTTTSAFMIACKNDDIPNYKAIAQQAWDMECDLWSGILQLHCPALIDIYDYMRFTKDHLPKVKIIVGRYRWLAWRSKKGIRAKRTCLKMHACIKKEEEALMRTL